jgi:hypothetical protein
MQNRMILRFKTIQQIDALVIQTLGQFFGNKLGVSGS